MKNDKLTCHKVNPCNDAIDIRVADDPGAGGASHEYQIYMANDEHNDELNAAWVQTVSFQNGPINESGVNGVTHEALLAIIKHRLESFQDGDFACHENEMALQKVDEAMLWMHSRTLARMRRGVEGTHGK